jgi:hypothetical protein
MMKMMANVLSRCYINYFSSLVLGALLPSLARSPCSCHALPAPLVLLLLATTLLYYLYSRITARASHTLSLSVVSRAWCPFWCCMVVMVFGAR